MMTLAAYVARYGPLSVRDALGWTLRAAKTLELLHAQQIVHGAIGADAVLISGADCTKDGALLDASFLVGNPVYYSLGRIDTGKPSAADDLWALNVTLYFALTGKFPYGRGIGAARESMRPPPPLAVYGAQLDVMQPMMSSLLNPDLIGRADSASPLVKELQTFSPANADLPELPILTGDDEAVISESMSPPGALVTPSAKPPRVRETKAAESKPTTEAAQAEPAPSPAPPTTADARAKAKPKASAPPMPPPLPQAKPAAPPLAQFPAARARPRRGLWWLVIAAVLVCVIAVAWVLIMRARSRTKTVAITMTATADSGSVSPPTTSTPATSTPVASTAGGPDAQGSAPDASVASIPVPRAELNRCVSALFPPGAFRVREPDFSFLCEQTDPKKAADGITEQIAGASAGVATDASKEWDALGWYRFAFVAIAYRHCCTHPKPLTTPKMLEPCGFADKLESLAAKARLADDDETLKALNEYNTAISCVHRAGFGSWFGESRKPDSAQTATFVRTLMRMRRAMRR